MNSAFETKRNESMRGAGQAGRLRGAVFTHSWHRIVKLGHVARLLLCHRKGALERLTALCVSAVSTRSGRAFRGLQRGMMGSAKNIAGEHAVEIQLVNLAGLEQFGLQLFVAIARAQDV